MKSVLSILIVVLLTGTVTLGALNACPVQKHFCCGNWQNLSIARKGSAEFTRKVAAGQASQR